MTLSRTPGQAGTVDDEVIAPVTYLPGVREAEAENARRELEEAESNRAADAKRAENVSMHALTRRGQPRAEIAELLRRREITTIAIETELKRLESVGLIDDRALAIELVDQLRSRKKLGPSAVRNELMRRKVDRGAIDEALAEGDDSAEGDRVLDLAKDRARRLGGLDRTTAERRLVDYLARKGHTGAAARDAARRALDGENDLFDDSDDSDDAASGQGATVHRVQFR